MKRRASSDGTGGHLLPAEKTRFVPGHKVKPQVAGSFRRVCKCALNYASRAPHSAVRMEGCVMQSAAAQEGAAAHFAACFFFPD
jgi:hypothetical protein